MREFIRPVAVALSIAGLAASMAVVSNTEALAQAKQQMAPAQGSPASHASGRAGGADRKAGPGCAFGEQGHGCDHGKTAGERPA